MIQVRLWRTCRGVLFIDEAYSLVDGSHSFGDEAINTIVQEMENHRDDVVVIFAGYSDQMEEFLNKNPGLRSRIAHHVSFEDYDTDELLQITDLMVGQKNMKLTDDARRKLIRIYDNARGRMDFGNGRYVRNVVEKMIMTHASALLDRDYDTVTDDEIMTITAEDIEMPGMMMKTEKRFGFCA